MITENSIAEIITDALNMLDDENSLDGKPRMFKDISTFKENGIMSTNTGIVLILEDRSEFQITIVQSR